jgi:hypothetical protein
VVVAAVGLRCADFEGLKVTPRPSTPATEAGACLLAHPPAPPSLPDIPGTAKVDFTAVVWQIDLGELQPADGGLPPYETAGFDLDNACTTADAGATCTAPSWASGPHPDGPGGIDNAMGAIQYQVNRMDGGSISSELMSVEHQGIVNLAIRVRQFPEGPYGTVDVSYYGVRFHPADDGGASPKYDGTDAWDVYTPWLQPVDGGAWDVDSPLYDDPAAYVTAGQGPPGAAPTVLVSHMNQLVLGGWPQYNLVDVVMTAEVVKVDAGWTLTNIVFGAREDAGDYLHHLVNVPDPVNPGHYFCKGQGSYQIAHDFICSFVDIRLDGADDGRHPCDALSWGWRYHAAEPVPGNLGIGPDTLPEVPTDCPANASPLMDRCGQ